MAQVVKTRHLESLRNRYAHEAAEVEHELVESFDAVLGAELAAELRTLNQAVEDLNLVIEYTHDR